MTEQMIMVSPVVDGWAVYCDGLEAGVFRTGGRAEAAARRLAQAFAQTGRHATVVVHDRTGALAGTHQQIARGRASPKP